MTPDRIEVTFAHDDGQEAGTLRLDHVPRVGDTVLWLTEATDPDGTVYDHDVEYPVTAVQWTLNSEGGHSLARVTFGPAIGPEQQAT